MTNPDVVKDFIKSLFIKYNISYDVIDFIWKSGIFELSSKVYSQKIMGLISQQMDDIHHTDEQFKIVILVIKNYREMFNNDTKEFTKGQ
jgi:hypothetical protein